MSLVTICKNDNSEISPNFLSNEFYSNSNDAPDCHTLDSQLIEALQLVRTTYNIPICITSTYRTQLANNLIGSSSNSQHRTPEGAVDFQACNRKDRRYLIGQLYAEFKNKGDVYQALRTIGINGFGFYDTFNHFDVRANYSGEVDYWDNTSGIFGDTTIDGQKKNLITRFWSSWGGEDGYSDYQKNIQILLGATAVVIIGGIVKKMLKK